MSSYKCCCCPDDCCSNLRNALHENRLYDDVYRDIKLKVTYRLRKSDNSIPVTYQKVYFQVPNILKSDDFNDQDCLYLNGKGANYFKKQDEKFDTNTTSYSIIKAQLKLKKEGLLKDRLLGSGNLPYSDILDIPLEERPIQCF